MDCTVDNAGVVRKRADWMMPVDDTILEILRDEAKVTPRELDDRDVANATYASNRLSELASYGLATRLSRGLYGLTEKGEAYLDEELDAGTLTKDGE